MASICFVILAVVLVGQILAEEKSKYFSTNSRTSYYYDCAVCNNGALQLDDDDPLPNSNRNELQGCVQYCRNEQWQSLCVGGGNWTRVEANVVCRQLGHSGQGIL